MNYFSREGKQLLISIMEDNNLPFNPKSIDLKLNINNNSMSLTEDNRNNLNEVFNNIRIMSTVSFELCFSNESLNVIINPIEHLNESLLKTVSDIVNLKLFNIKINKNCVVDSFSFEKLVNSKLNTSHPNIIGYAKLNTQSHLRTFKHKPRIYSGNISIVN